MYIAGKCKDKKYRFQPSIVRNDILKVILLAEAPNIEVLFSFHSLNYEVLSGNKIGISSVRIDKQYRLEFIVSKDDEDEPTIAICTLINISNHYK